MPERVSLAFVDEATTDMEADVVAAISAVRRVRSDGLDLRKEFVAQQEQVYALRQVLTDLIACNEDAKRELAAAAKMLAGEQDRVTALERTLRFSEKRVKFFEDRNAILRAHIDNLLASIRENTPVSDDVERRPIVYHLLSQGRSRTS